MQRSISAVCDTDRPTKKRRVADVVEEGFYALPSEILVFITSKLDIFSLASFGSTCKMAHSVTAPHLYSVPVLYLLTSLQDNEEHF
jgi:hypothetical protein